MEEQFNIVHPIYLREQFANLDYLYGPYESVAAANAAIPAARRAIGLTVAVIEEGGAVEYWYKAGTQDIDLVHKIEETVPKLEYTEEYPQGTILHSEVGGNLVVTVKFTSKTYGQCTLTVTKDGAPFKTVKANKGIISVDLGVQNADGSFEYRISGVDALTIPAEEVLAYRAVVGGAKISTDLQEIIDNGINTESDITITYNASVADTSKVVKVRGELRSSDNALVSSCNVTGSGTSQNVISGQQWNLGALGTADTYTVTMYSYTGDTPQDISGENVSTSVSYTFVLMAAGTFIMSSDLETYSCDTNTSVSIPYRIYSGTRMTLQAHGELRDSNNNVVQNYNLNRSVESNVLQHWSLGKIALEGNYTIRLWATDVGGQPSNPPGYIEYTTIAVSVSYYAATYSIVTNGLIGDFSADGKSNNNDDDKAGYWRNSIQGSNIYFQLNDLNYTTNGWKHVDPEVPDSEPAGEMMLKFTGESYGRLKQRVGAVPSDSDPDYLPMSNLGSSAAEGFTTEIIYRTRCIGELNAKVMTGHNGSGTNSAGFSASFDTLTVGSNGAQVKLDVAEEEWVHATMVVDKTVHTEVDDVQDYAPRKLMTIYINGSACASAIITDNMNFSNYGPVMLNAAMNTLYDRVDFFGSCEIKAIRFYNRPLYASEVVNNYIASIYDSERQTWVAGRNRDVLPIVRFINIRREHPQSPLPKGCSNVDFATLNLMTDKKRQKKEYVCARILYQENASSQVIEWPRCTIQTQGTSTLAFPVKNYKIRLFDDADNQDGSNKYKHKYYTDAFASKGWQPEYVYTLKCDYMEAAHLNNTPSCEFYNEMIDSLVEEKTIADGWNAARTVYTNTNDHRSPSRRDEKLDAIKGFPCLVYYYESEDDYQANNGVYVGSYMFNLDKAADSLGFDAPAKLDTDGETAIQVRNPRYTVGGDKPEYLDNICQSFEGVANGSDTAGCFFSYDNWKDSYYSNYIDKAFDVYSGAIDNREDFVTYYRINHPDERYRNDTGELEGFCDDHGYLLARDAFITASGKYPTEYDYFAGDFEMRYDWDDLEEGGAEFWGDSTWGLKRMIDWVATASATSGSGSDVFREEFSDYFNLDYCLLYYLQMIVFGQVDNAGKNAMWDTWDGLHWYPRPYDLDTMAGLNNTGIEMINPDAELHPDLSPYLNYNTTVVTTGYSENTSPVANLRYEAYNTRTSKFWLAFATSFATEIKTMYKDLRDNGVYTIEHIMTKFKSKTSDIIGEAFYNRDMATKFYKLSEITEYIDRMHGNRVQRFQAWMTERIIFCDTLFDYISETISLNNNIFLRSDAFENNVSIPVSLGIKTYSPQYVFIDVGSGYDCKLKAYCSPDARYEDPVTHEEKEGTLFTIPLTAGNKEIFIYGAGNIKEIVNFGGLKANSLVLNNAKKITSLDVSYSTKLLSLSLSNNTYLQNLDCHGSVRLGTDASGAQLDLSNCVNLKTVNLSDTALTAVVLPQGGSLKSIQMNRTNITEIDLDSLYFLNQVSVVGCEYLLRYVINNCPKIETLVADSLPLVRVEITDCENLRVISLRSDNNIQTLYIARCPSIEEIYLTNSRSASMGVMDFTTLYSLSTLDISGSSVTTVKLPLHTSATSDDPWGEDFTTFNLASSDITYVQYGETASNSVDLSQLSNLSSLSFDGCSSVERITGLNYTGSCVNLFRGCRSLDNIFGSITCVGSAENIFRECINLSFGLAALSNREIIFDFSQCTSLRYAFSACPYVNYLAMKYILNTCTERLKDISYMCFRHNFDGTTYTDYSGYEQSVYRHLVDGMFDTCTGITNADLAFDTSGINGVISTGFLKRTGTSRSAFPELKSAIRMFSSTAITDIPDFLFEYFPKLEDASGMFLYCTSLTMHRISPSGLSAMNGEGYGLTTVFKRDYMHEDTNDDYPLKKIDAFFYGCTNLEGSFSNDMMDEFLIWLSKLETAQLVFSGCSTIDGTVPEGFFRYCPRLTSIAGFFRGTSIDGLPSGSLFRASGDTSTNMNNLEDISSLFENCTGLTGNINGDLFTGGLYVTDATAKKLLIPASGDYPFGGVFQGCTGITGFDSDLFLAMPRLKYISGFFRGCSHLISQTGGGFDPAMLNTHNKLDDVSNLFNGCTQLSVATVPQLFTASKGTVRNASGVFSGCKSISGYDEALFTNMTKLTNVSNAFYGCTGLTIDISQRLPFAGCTSLQNVSGFYYGCNKISGSIRADLFDDCRDVLANTSYMFYGCEELDGTIQTGNEDIYQPGDSEFKFGLLAECINLSTTAGMFSGCLGITGSIPWDIFWTRSYNKLYAQLTDIHGMFYNAMFSTPTVVDGTSYFFHPQMLVKLQRVTNMERLFSMSATYRGTAYSKWSSQSYPVSETSFDGQYFVTSIRHLFSNRYSLGGAVSNHWFINSMNTITDAYGAFAFTKITDVGTSFLRASSNSTNKTLTTAGRMCYDCSSISGTLPPMNNISLYSKINYSDANNGYHSFAYNCTAASNYSDFSGDWIIPKTDYYG